MKLFSKTISTPSPSRSEALACTPVVSTQIHWQILADGCIRLEYPLVIKPFFQSLLRRFQQQSPAPMTKKLDLDSMGSLVWQMIDGNRNVKTIIEQFARESSITLQEAELSVTTFLRELGKRGLISLH